MWEESGVDSANHVLWKTVVHVFSAWTKESFWGPGIKKQCCALRQCVLITNKQSDHVIVPHISKVARNYMWCDVMQKTPHLVQLYDSCIFIPISIQCPNWKESVQREDCNKFLATQDRQRKLITGDGNCFFRALSYILYGTEDEHKKLRVILADFILENKEIFRVWSFEADLKDMCRR